MSATQGSPAGSETRPTETARDAPHTGLPAVWVRYASHTGLPGCVGQRRVPHRAPRKQSETRPTSGSPAVWVRDASHTGLPGSVTDASHTGLSGNSQRRVHTGLPGCVGLRRVSRRAPRLCQRQETSSTVASSSRTFYCIHQSCLSAH